MFNFLWNSIDNTARQHNFSDLLVTASQNNYCGFPAISVQTLQATNITRAKGSCSFMVYSIHRPQSFMI